MLKLVQTDWGQFDLQVDDGADADAVVATLIYALLFTNGVAPDGRVSDPYNQGGWWADDTVGSGLWHVRMQALTPAARREALAAVAAALQDRDPALTDVTVTEVTPEEMTGISLQTARAGNISGLTVAVSGFHNGRKFIVKAAL